MASSEAFKGHLGRGDAPCRTCGEQYRAHFMWRAVGHGEMDCCCCGTHWGGETAECGKHHYCGICVGRGHDEEHDCAEYDSDSQPFDRMASDCPACGERHLDWERCEKAWNDHSDTVMERCNGMKAAAALAPAQEPL